MLSTQQKDLWYRIRDFAIDDPSAFVKYSDKLAHTNGWSKDYTARVIEEYRKFIFLCCILPNGASPSKPVDEAWHLHLTYTHNYWKEFCGDVLMKDIHHFPSKGGPEENEKHITWYNDTLDAYRSVFDIDAPDDIWIRPQHSVGIDHPTHNASWTYTKIYKKYLYILFLPLIMSVILFGKINPYDLTGPRFLVFFGAVMAAVATYLFLIQAAKRKEIRQMIIENYEGDADVYQLARYVYGREHSFRAAIVDLVGRHILEPQRRSRFIFNSQNYRYSSSENNPLVIHLLRNLSNDTSLHYRDLSVYYDDGATYHTGLSRVYESVAKKDMRPLYVVLTIAVMAIARIFQGIHNHKPVNYLLTMCFVFAVFGWFIISQFSPKTIIRGLFVEDFKAAPAGLLASTALASSFVFLGFSSLTGMGGYNRLQNTFMNNRAAYGGDSFSSCGSGCGGSGCGGGGCGGGCGGCGGS